MTSLELLESFVAVKDKFVLEAHEEALPENNIIPFDNRTQSEDTPVHTVKKQSRRRTPMKKSALIAIIAAAVLCLAGFAYAVIKLQELSLGEYTYTQPDRLNPSETVHVTSEFISMQGLKDSPEYRATKEWNDFLNSYDTDRKILSEVGNNPTGFEGLNLFYQVYTQEMYDKLVEIADKYDLKLHSEMNIISQEELDYRVGGSFMGDGLSRGWAYICEDGTFQFDGDTAINEKEVMLQLRRSVKGTLDEPVLNIGSIEEYQEVQYETECGETVLLALGEDHSVIYADFEDCFILMNVLAGRELGILNETTITIDDLKRMADDVDFSILKKVITPDMQGDSDPGTSGTSSDESSKQPDSAIDTEADSLFERFLRGEIAAEGNGLYSSDSFFIDELVLEETWDSYSVGEMVDLDNDGEDELILDGPYGGMYLDASDGIVRVLAAGDGTARNLSYVKCGDEYWIVHSDILHSDRKYYHLEMYAGADKIAGSITLESRYSAENMVTYYLNGTEVSEAEYEETYQKYLGDGRIAAYQSVLLDVYHNQKFPGGRDLGYDGWPISDNRFALEDVDSDGSVELIVIYSTTSTAGHAHIIYDYDASTGGVREQFIEYPGVVYFDNGILKVDASHNHTLSGKIWPYTLYQYNAVSDSYDVIAQVEAWDKEIRDTDYEGNVFPDDVDQDDDQTVYYIMGAEGYENRTPVDGAEYDKWYESYRCRTDFADIQNKKECGGNRQWQNHYLRNWAANTKGKGII